MIQELERVVLTKDLPEEHLQAGDLGTVVLVHGKGAAYEVEFLTLKGRTLAVVTLEASEVRPIGPGDIPHARKVA